MSTTPDMNKEREALQTYLKDCEAHAIVPDVGGAWHAAFQAGRASLAASAGSEPVAWLVPQLHTFKGAERVHFTRAPGCTMTDAELIEYMDGRVMWLPTTFCDSENVVTDKFGVTHKPKPLYTHPSPPEGAGWKLVPIAPTNAMLQAMDRAFSDAMHVGIAVSPEAWAAGIASAPPASEAKGA